MADTFTDSTERMKLAPDAEMRALWAERIYLRFRKEEMQLEVTAKEAEFGPLKGVASHPGPKDKERIASEQRALYLKRRIKELGNELKQVAGQLKSVNQRLRQLDTK